MKRKENEINKLNQKINMLQNEKKITGQQLKRASMDRCAKTHCIIINTNIAFVLAEIN